MKLPLKTNAYQRALHLDSLANYTGTIWKYRTSSSSYTPPIEIRPLLLICVHWLSWSF